MASLRMALAQTHITLGAPEANRARLATWAQRAAAAGADFLLLPELWDVGYAHGKWSGVAAPLEGGSFAALAQAAKEHGIHVVASSLERHAQGISNTAVVVSPDGRVLGAYRKVHLIPLFREDRYLYPGEGPVLVEFPWGKAGMAICYDLRFPELFRAYALEGAVVTFLVAEWPKERIAHWEVLVRARAVENQQFVVACNRTGADASGTFGGRSLVVGPWGEVLAEADEAEVLLVADVHLDKVQEARDRLPALRDRRPAAYGRLGVA
ncbi:MAG: carbon-nitrogen family hydrolase [Anaerolineae bacterium]|nr:carbon-nitrogen family hydrolase [Anaerolineae bacterium]